MFTFLSHPLCRAAHALCVFFLAGSAAAAPPAELWPRWQQHDPAATESIDHGNWTAFLQSYVMPGHPSGIHRVRYAEVTRAERQALRAYIERLQAVPISRFNRAEQLAYWINLYNAATVDIVLEHFPVASIRDINPSSGFLSGLFGSGPWREKLLTVEGEAISLDDIEHRILRPIWGDNRIHYGVNCASLGCPDLQPVAFTANNTIRLLDEGARAYVNHPRGVSVQDGKLRLSSIYDWFQEDFGGNTRGVLAHLIRYAKPDLRERLAGYEGSIGYDYDWSLNAP